MVEGRKGNKQGGEKKGLQNKHQQEREKKQVEIPNPKRMHPCLY